MKDLERYQVLAEKWLRGTITKDEMAEFNAWFNNGLEEDICVPKAVADSKKTLRKRMLQNILSGETPKARIRKMFGKFSHVAAACIILALCFTSSLLLKPKVKTPAAAVAKAAPDHTTNHNKAVLRLDDGSEIVLDTAQEGMLANNNGVQVMKLDLGKLAYKASASSDLITYNTLVTPKGGQYQLTLVDGTNIWLNATSSLRFPTGFRGKERVVELEGEAYFEVAKNANAPFKVKTHKMDIQVLGTHFNVMAYRDEVAAKTTLVEGSVKVMYNNKEARLSPGQQSQVTENNIAVVAADEDEALAWKNGLFHFNNTDIKTIMRQISRWYDVEVIYEDEVRDKFSGTISKNVSLEKIFQMLELTTAVRFSVKGNRVVVRS